jgi:hypothetical protein
MMTATALSPGYFDEIIAEDKIEFPVKGHRGGHIGKESSQGRHFSLFPLPCLYYNFIVNIASDHGRQGAEI